MSARVLENLAGGGRPSKRPHLGSQRHSLTPQDLQRENKQLREEIEGLRRKVAESEKHVADQEKQTADQEKEIADLERQLAGRKKDSTNSSKPPSSDGPAAARRLKPARCRGRRKPGGQKGHPGSHRTLEPLERVDQVVPVLPSECRHCDHPLPQRIEEAGTRGEVYRFQVTELPPLRAHITEYQCHKVACPNCGLATRAEPPAAVRVSAFGPRLTGLIAYLTVAVRIPRRGVEQLLATALGIDISLGSTQKLVEETSEALAKTVVVQRLCPLSCSATLSP